MEQQKSAATPGTAWPCLSFVQSISALTRFTLQRSCVSHLRESITEYVCIAMEHCNSFTLDNASFDTVTCTAHTRCHTPWELCHCLGDTDSDLQKYWHCRLAAHYSFQREGQQRDKRQCFFMQCTISLWNSLGYHWEQEFRRIQKRHGYLYD